MKQMVKHNAAPRNPMILSNSGNKIAIRTNTAFTAILLNALTEFLNNFVDDGRLSSMCSTFSIESKIDTIGLEFSGVFASGIRDRSTEISA